MVQRTFPQHAGAAPGVVRDDRVRIAHRPRRALIGRTKDRRDRRANCRRQMHGSGIVRHERSARRQHAGKRRQVRSPDDVEQGASREDRRCPFRLYGPRHGVGRLAIGCAANHHCLDAIARELVSQRRKAIRRPTLRAAVRGARRDGRERRPRVPTGFPQDHLRRCDSASRRLEARLAGTVGEAKRPHQPLVIRDLMASP
jgi:hypothetical protein